MAPDLTAPAAAPCRPGRRHRTRLVDPLQHGVTTLDDRGRAELVLEGYGHRWLRLTSDASPWLR